MVRLSVELPQLHREVGAHGNEVSGKAAQRARRWITKKQLRDLTKGASKELGLPSQVIQEVIDEVLDKRNAAGRPRLRWRASRGALSAGSPSPTRTSPSRDRSRTCAGASSGFGSTARSSRARRTVRRLWASTSATRPWRRVQTAPSWSRRGFYRDLEQKLADAERRGRMRLVRTINAKISNRRKDTFHKFTRQVVDRGRGPRGHHLTRMADRGRQGNARRELDPAAKVLRLQTRSRRSGLRRGE